MRRCPYPRHWYRLQARYNPTCFCVNNLHKAASEKSRKRGHPWYQNDTHFAVFFETLNLLIFHSYRQDTIQCSGRADAFRHDAKPEAQRLEVISLADWLS